MDVASKVFSEDSIFEHPKQKATIIMRLCALSYENEADDRKCTDSFVRGISAICVVMRATHLCPIGEHYGMSKILKIAYQRINVIL